MMKHWIIMAMEQITSDEESAPCLQFNPGAASNCFPQPPTTSTAESIALFDFCTFILCTEIASIGITAAVREANHTLPCLLL